MGYDIAYTIEDLLHIAERHRWMAIGALVALLVVILYQVIKRQY